MIPPCSTGSNGLPVATSAAPSVHAIRSAGIASALEVGLDSGMMIGRGQCASISRTICSVNAPDWVEHPISIVGRTCRTTSARPGRCPGPPQSRISSHLRA